MFAPNRFDLQTVDFHLSQSFHRSYRVDAPCGPTLHARDHQRRLHIGHGPGVAVDAAAVTQEKKKAKGVMHWGPPVLSESI
jgi:hypothetical protein